MAYRGLGNRSHYTNVYNEEPVHKARQIHNYRGGGYSSRYLGGVRGRPMGTGAGGA